MAGGRFTWMAQENAVNFSDTLRGIDMSSVTRITAPTGDQIAQRQFQSDLGLFARRDDTPQPVARNAEFSPSGFLHARHPRQDFGISINIRPDEPGGWTGETCLTVARQKVAPRQIQSFVNSCRAKFVP